MQVCAALQQCRCVQPSNNAGVCSPPTMQVCAALQQCRCVQPSNNASVCSPPTMQVCAALQRACMQARPFQRLPALPYLALPPQPCAPPSPVPPQPRATHSPAPPGLASGHCFHKQSAVLKEAWALSLSSSCSGKSRGGEGREAGQGQHGWQGGSTWQAGLGREAGQGWVNLAGRGGQHGRQGWNSYGRHTGLYLCWRAGPTESLPA